MNNSTLISSCNILFSPDWNSHFWLTCERKTHCVGVSRGYGFDGAEPWAKKGVQHRGCDSHRRFVTEELCLFWFEIFPSYSIKWIAEISLKVSLYTLRLGVWSQRMLQYFRFCFVLLVLVLLFIQLHMLIQQVHPLIVIHNWNASGFYKICIGGKLRKIKQWFLTPPSHPATQ